MEIPDPLITMYVDSEPIDENYPYGGCKYTVTVNCFGWPITEYCFWTNAYRQGNNYASNSDDALESAEKRFAEKLAKLFELDTE